jgi:hypothetical protein
MHCFVHHCFVVIRFFFFWPLYYIAFFDLQHLCLWCLQTFISYHKLYILALCVFVQNNVLSCWQFLKYFFHQATAWSFKICYYLLMSLFCVLFNSYVCGETAYINLIDLVLTRPESNPRSAVLEASTLSITPHIRLYYSVLVNDTCRENWHTKSRFADLIDCSDLFQFLYSICNTE